MDWQVGLEKDLVRDEGTRTHPYRDTAGKITIGVGRDLTDVGLSEGEIAILLHADMQRAIEAAEDLAGVEVWAGMSPHRRRALANMAFNLGRARLARFTQMLDALRDEDWDAVASECLASLWAAEVGQRAVRIAQQFEEG